MIFYPTGRANGTDPCFYLHDSRLGIVEEYKYLGVFISRNFHDSQDVERGVDSFDKQFPLILHFTCSECIAYHLWMSTDVFKEKMLSNVKNTNTVA